MRTIFQGKAAVCYRLIVEFTHEDVEAEKVIFWDKASNDPQLLHALHRTGYTGDSIPDRATVEGLLPHLYSSLYNRMMVRAVSAVQPDFVIHLLNVAVSPSEAGITISARYFLLPKLTFPFQGMKSIPIPTGVDFRAVASMIYRGAVDGICRKHALRIPRTTAVEIGDEVSVEFVDHHAQVVVQASNQVENSLANAVIGLSIGGHTVQMNGRNVGIIIQGISQVNVTEFDERVMNLYGDAMGVKGGPVAVQAFLQQSCEQEAKRKLRDDVKEFIFIELLRTVTEEEPFPDEWLEAAIEANAREFLRPGTPLTPDVRSSLADQAMISLRRVAIYVSVGKHLNIARVTDESVASYAGRVADIVIDRLKERQDSFAALSNASNLGTTGPCAKHRTVRYLPLMASVIVAGKSSALNL